MFRKRSLLAALAVVGALSVVGADFSLAKPGGSIGSRGMRTYQAPPTTTTAPSTAAPIQRSTAPQAAPSATGAIGSQAARRPSMFGNGFAGNLMRGLLIGGLIGLLMGQGLGGLAGLLGLLLQGALIALAVMLVLRLLRRPQPVPAGGPARAGWPGGQAAPASGPLHRDAYGAGPAGNGPAGNGPGAPAGYTAAPPRGGQADEIGVTPQDLDTFERLLGEIQTAFGREDQGTLKQHTTAEVFGYLADELRENAEKGVRNTISDVKLLQGDIAESWREGTRDYATVALRYQSRDATVDRATGRFISGDRDGPGQNTEVWTFVRDAGGPWILTAIQTA